MTDTTAIGRVDPSAEHRLPYTVAPRRYDLRLAPDLAAATFTGEVRITLEVAEGAGDRIVLHAAELTVDRARLERPGRDGEDLAVTLEEVDERLVLRSASSLEAGPAVLELSFAGILNDKLHGFYRSEYSDEAGTTHVIATTQFEATDARRAFPCFDEPDRKAVFSVTLDVPPGLEGYANGPALEETPLASGGRRVRFGDTIPMSTYLVAFVVGPLVATDPVVVRGTLVRVVHVPGKEDLTAFALEAAAHALEFFAQWFGIEYPAEKLDLLAIPDFAFGAMENLGCVTFREAVLLVDPARASRLELERVADVISHEIAHMWFGDLVTMRWWNGIWLNEAFATFMELLCVDAFRPDWQRWVSFGMERDVAMATDALHSTRPVEYPVGPPSEAQGMFDVLTYQTGAGVLRMLERYLGAERFRQGIRRYLDAHRLGNTDTADLWAALEEASGEPVGDIMDSWILQGGFPLVLVDPAGEGDDPGAVVLSQEPFSYAPPEGPSAIGTSWSVPVMARRGEDAEVRVLLGTTPERLAPGEVPADVTVVNAGGSGYYRVRYAEAQRRALARALPTLGRLERFNLVGDTWAAVVAGRSELGDLLELAEALGDERDPAVWGQVSGPLSFLDHAVDDGARPALASYTRALLAPVLGDLGWAARAGEDSRIPTLRAQVVAALGTVGQDGAVRAEARRRLVAAGGGEEAVAPDLVAAVLGVVAASGGEDDYEDFLAHYRAPSTPQEELRYLYALTAFPDPALAARTFALARTEIRSQNAPFVVNLLLAQRDVGPGVWLLVQDHWDELTSRIPANTQSRMVDSVRLLCRDPALAATVRAFLERHPLTSGQRTVEQTIERLGVNVTLAGRLAASAVPALEAGLARLGPR